HEETEKNKFFLLLIFIKLPVILVLIVSWIFPYSIWGTRHLIIVFAPMVILAAILIEKINFKTLKISFITLLTLLFGTSFVLQLNRSQSKYIWCGWENLAQNIEAGQQQKIYVFEDLVTYHYCFAIMDNE